MTKIMIMSCPKEQYVKYNLPQRLMNFYSIKDTFYYAHVHEISESLTENDIIILSSSLIRYFSESCQIVSGMISIRNKITLRCKVGNMVDDKTLLSDYATYKLRY